MANKGEIEIIGAYFGIEKGKVNLLTGGSLK